MTLRATWTCLRVAAQQEWPRETWATQLAGLLSGNALDSYSSLPSDRSRDYGNLKAAILRLSERDEGL